MIEKESDDNKKKLKTYDANFNNYMFMAHYVAKILKLRPNEILDHWGVSELVVAYGFYRNEEQLKAFNEVESYNANNKKKIPRIDKYAVYFFTKEEMEENNG